MITFYCPNCWSEIDEKEKSCHVCNYDISKYDSFDYTDKLINALSHPISDVRIFAARLLGKNKVKKSIPALIECLKVSKDMYFQKAIIETLGNLGALETLEIVKIFSANGNPLIVRNAASKTILKLSKKDSKE